MRVTASPSAPCVSVVIPLYGDHAGRQTLRGVAEAWRDQDESTEIVIVTAGPIPLDSALSTMEGVRLVVAPQELTAPGLLRNVGAVVADGTWLYLSDSDVAPLGRDYLTRVIATAGSGSFVKPSMLRLIGEVPGGMASRWSLRERREEPFSFVQADSNGQLSLVPGERLVWADGAPMVVPPPSYVDPEDPGDFGCRTMVHWGGGLVRRERFVDVGGYCTRFQGWGCEDDDLIVKLDAAGGVAYGFRDEPELRCLHFEHPRPYTLRQIAGNEAIAEERMARGADAMIADDMRGFSEVVREWEATRRRQRLIIAASGCDGLSR